MPAAQTRPALQVIPVDSPAALERWLPAWRELAAAAVEPNPFYEPFMLLPALHHLRQRRRVTVVLVVEEGPLPRLCGLFPLAQLDLGGGLKLPAYELWRHAHSYCCAPLVRHRHERAVLGALFDWLPAHMGALAMPLLRTGQALHRAVVDLVNERGLEAQTIGAFTRALLHPAPDAEDGADRSRHERKELRRKSRRLTELGRISYDSLPPDGDLARWTEEFLALEQGGWKGHQGSALASSPSGRRFFLSMTAGAFAEQRLLLLALRLDGRAIAQTLLLRGGDGAFGFKMAFDERYARYSPGSLLLQNGVEQSLAGLRWLDPCTNGDSAIEHAWSGRIAYQALLVSTGRSRLDALLVAGLPLAAHLYRTLRRSGPRLPPVVELRRAALEQLQRLAALLRQTPPLPGEGGPEAPTPSESRARLVAERAPPEAADPPRPAGAAL